MNGFMTTMRFVTVGLVALVLSACGSAPEPRVGRAVTSQYKGWTIVVTPSSASSDVWRARVRVWPRDVDPQRHGGIMLRFTGAARSESAVVASGMAFARAYIDDSTFDAATDPRQPPSEPEEARTVTADHHDWTVQITPSATASAAVAMTLSIMAASIRRFVRNVNHRPHHEHATARH